MEDFVPVARMTRVNKLLHQSIADILRRRWSRETVAITLTAVECSGDLRDAKVRYSVLGDDKREAVDFFRKNVKEIGYQLAKDVTIKRHPRLHFVYDDSLKRMAAVDKALMEIEAQKVMPKVELKPKTKSPRARKSSE